MDVLFERCCGLDVHKKLVVACVIITPSGGEPERTVHSFGTMTEDLLKLADWLETCGVSHVAMESTGVYWQPIWNLLEERFTLVLVNAQHVHQVPGHKTDVRDCEWLAELLRHGLLRGSFVPDRAQRELRELVRYRTGLVRQRAQVTNRVQMTLEGANIKLASAANQRDWRFRPRHVGRIGQGRDGRGGAGQIGTMSYAAQALGARSALSGRMGPHQQSLLQE